MHANNILDIVRVTPRNRKPQWTHKETQHLIREFDKRKLILRPKPGEVVSSASKHRAWVEIAQAVNLTNPHVHRTVSEVQKKWQNLCLRTKKDKDGIPVDSLLSTVSRAEQSILDEHQSQNPPALSIQPRQMLMQPYHSSENSGGNGLVPVKIEKVDVVDEMMRANHVDTAGDSRPESTRSQLSYGDVEFIDPVTSQPEYDMYATSSGIVHAAHDPESLGSVPSIIPTNESPRGQKRKHSNPDNTLDNYNYTMGDTDLVDVRRNLMMAEMQKYKLECEKIRTEKDKLLLETEKILMEKEKLVLELQTLRATSEELRIRQNKSVSQLEKERMSLENEKLLLEIENMRSLHKAAVEKTQLEKQRFSLENDKLNIEIQNLRGSNRNNTYQAMI
ncbi:myb/SANT-like DNA-binding domain-containing protein 4 [Argopecten irradians]|uniref:myb/SANT-like DNA-binding domain-containing protein 4 n=1 Tax=Argopecten irradians TaxID=31199 RepID=UPI0037229CF8